MKLIQNKKLPTYKVAEKTTPVKIIPVEGSVKIVPEGGDDLWVLHNVICEGDSIFYESTTTKKVCGNNTKLQLNLRVLKVDYEKQCSILRIHGKSLSDKSSVAAGAFHTLQIEPHQSLQLTKKVWDKVALDSLTRACNGSFSKTKGVGADMAVLLIEDGRMASLFLVNNTGNTLSTDIYGGCDDKFFEEILSEFKKHVDLGLVRFVVIGSLGKLKDQFQSYLLKQQKQLIMQHKTRLLLVSTGSSSGKKKSLKEVMEDPKVINLRKDTNGTEELKALKELTELMRVKKDGGGRVCYGTRSVEAAQEMDAVEKLLITENLYRSTDVETRRRYVELVSAVEKSGGIAHVFSSKHESAEEELAKFTGIAAILRFPLPHLEDEDDQF